MVKAWMDATSDITGRPMGELTGEFRAREFKEMSHADQAEMIREALEGRPAMLQPAVVVAGPGSATVFALDDNRVEIGRRVSTDIRLDKIPNPGSASGTYRKVPMIGGERLVPIYSYAGKRKGVILVFAERSEDGYIPSLEQHQLVEIPLSECYGWLENFEQYFEDMLHGRDSKLVAKAEKAKVTEEARLAADPLCGSW